MYWTDVSAADNPGSYKHTVGSEYVALTNWGENQPGIITKVSKCLLT